MSVQPSGVEAATRAQVLAEALPHIHQYAGAIVVIKYGGNALADTAGGEGEALSVFAQDIALMAAVGLKPVVIHGGGPQISAMLGRLGKQPVFSNGLRVTDAETLDVARMVLVGRVNRDLVGAINVKAPIAVGISGEDAAFLQTRERDPALGYVGDIERVDPTLLNKLLDENLVPVVATIGSDVTGQAFNINADTAAAAIAVAVGARRLIHLTNVSGIRRVREDPATHAAILTADEVAELIGEGAIEGGMVPKAESCVHAVRNGVPGAHILDGRVPHVLLLELLTDTGVGTMVVSNPTVALSTREVLL